MQNRSIALSFGFGLPRLGIALLLLGSGCPNMPTPGDDGDLRGSPPRDLRITDGPPGGDLAGDGGLSCKAQEAKGVGPCDRILGWAWDGKACVPLSGCSCEGQECDKVFRGSVECEEAYKACGSGLRAVGSPCSKGEQCESGICEGKGCGPDEARCVPKERACRKDLVAYCGCDGMTFRASSDCPGRPFRDYGACP